MSKTALSTKKNSTLQENSQKWEQPRVSPGNACGRERRSRYGTEFPNVGTEKGAIVDRRQQVKTHFCNRKHGEMHHRRRETTMPGSTFPIVDAERDTIVDKTQQGQVQLKPFSKSSLHTFHARTTFPLVSFWRVDFSKGHLVHHIFVPCDLYGGGCTVF